MGSGISKYKSKFDLVKASQHEYDFLKIVSCYPQLFNPQYLQYSLQRYEFYWLPLAARYGLEIVAPLDIEWVWQVHMLSPYKYRKDCVNIVGKIVDHKLHDMDTRTEICKHTAKIWQDKYPVEPYEVDFTQPPKQDDSFQSKSSYDIVTAALRQSSFIYQISLPHYRDVKFLKMGEKRYQMLLLLKNENPSQFIVPCYDNDLIWHTHQLHPLLYERETASHLGQMLDHDDSVNDREPDGKLDTSCDQTAKLFKSKGKSFSVRGAMYRGEPITYTKCLDNLNIQFTDPRSYQFIIRSQTAQESPRLTDILCYPELLCPQAIHLDDTPCQYNHIYVSTADGMPTCILRVTHCKKPAISAVELFDVNNNYNLKTLLATGHTIGPSALPDASQVKIPAECVTLKAKVQRAMLIRSHNRDCFIVKGSWVNFEKGSRLGRFNVEVVTLNPPDGVLRSWSTEFDGRKDFIVRYYIGDKSHSINVDLTSGLVRLLSKVEHVPEVLCMASCVAVLFLLCHPRPPPKFDVATKAVVPYEEPPATRPGVLNISNMSFMIGAGLYNYYLPRYYGTKTIGLKSYYVGHLPHKGDPMFGDYQQVPGGDANAWDGGGCGGEGDGGEGDGGGGCGGCGGCGGGGGGGGCGGGGCGGGCGG